MYHNSLDYVGIYHVSCSYLHLFAHVCTALFPGIDALQLEDVRWCSREDVAAAVRMYDADQCAGGSSGGEWCCLIDLLID